MQALLAELSFGICAILPEKGLLLPTATANLKKQRLGLAHFYPARVVQFNPAKVVYYVRRLHIPSMIRNMENLHRMVNNFYPIR